MKIKVFFIVFLGLLQISWAANLYQQDSLQLQLHMNGEFDLVPTGSSARVKEVTTDILLYPAEEYRQSILSQETTGEVRDNNITFFWDDQKIEQKKFGYSSLIETYNLRKQVRTKIPYPFSTKDVEGYEQYLEPTKTIDSLNQAIIRQATELAEGEDDAFKVVFNLASWVESNVRYDLNTLTETASQKASWVLQNKQGVCDEMTSLFVAMARSVGIPARFVKGISYTTSELFDENWLPHGWAEVYFPDIGWASFDITFGEYGYIAVTHIKLRDSFDPAEPDTKYQWSANDVDLIAEPLQLAVSVKKEGNPIIEEILLEQEIVGEEVGFGSYNLIKGIVKNKADYYQATTLQLAVPPEIEILERNKRTLLLQPKETRETFWIIKASPDLDPSYKYTFPTAIYSEKNASSTASFTVVEDGPEYTESDVQKLTVQDEEKSYSRRVTFDCDAPQQLKLGETRIIQCAIKNSGNTNLQDIRFCLEEECKMLDLPINQQETMEKTVTAEKIGWNTLIVSAENNLIEKKIALEYVVLDAPTIAVRTEQPDIVQYREPFQITISLAKTSFSTPSDVTVILEGAGFAHEWKMEELTQETTFVLDLADLPLGRNNKFTVTTTWQDQEGTVYSDEKEIQIQGEAVTAWDKIKMFMNTLLGIFY